MKHRHTHEEEGGSDRWLLTYADMITLLMAFFIMMYSMSVLNLSKFREAAISIRSGFGGMVSGQGKSILGAGSAYSARPSPIEGIPAESTRRVLKPLLDFIKQEDPESMEMIEDERGIVIRVLSDNLLFEPGSARIREAAYPMLDRVAETLASLSNDVRVEGHTCDLPPKGTRYPSNWELSSARATNVLRHLVEIKGLRAERFSSLACGSAAPVQPNRDEASRERNRRVEIVIVRPPSSTGPGGSAGESRRPGYEIRRGD